MKKFNLAAALAGKPLVHKASGKKAYLVSESKIFPSYSVIEFSEKVVGIGLYATTLTDTIGNYFGMWEEPKPKRFINDIEVPEPVTEETWVNGGHYWYPTLDSNDCVRSDRFYTDVPIHTKLIRQGLVFKTEEDARIMTKALLNYTVEQRDE